jgi:hypothetical protein
MYLSAHTARRRHYMQECLTLPPFSLSWRLLPIQYLTSCLSLLFFFSGCYELTTLGT